MAHENASGEAPLYIGVDMGSSSILAGLVDATGAVVHATMRATKSEQGGELFSQLVEVIQELQTHPESGDRVAAIGVGLPGLVNTKTRRAVVLPNLPDLSGIDIDGELRRVTGKPVYLDNDSNAAGYGEMLCGAGRESRNLLYVYIGTGVGSGLILDGKVWRGVNGYAGEFGHMTIDPDGIECACGNIGCVETVCSAPNILRRMQERLYRDRTSSLSRLVIPRDREFTADDIAAAAKNGDELAQLIMERTGMFLGVALAGVINLINVDTVIIGGTVMAAGQALLDPIIEHTRSRAFRPAFDACRIVAAELGTRSGLIGAALLARDEA